MSGVPGTTDTPYVPPAVFASFVQTEFRSLLPVLKQELFSLVSGKPDKSLEDLHGIMLRLKTKKTLFGLAQRDRENLTQKLCAFQKEYDPLLNETHKTYILYFTWQLESKSSTATPQKGKEKADTFLDDELPPLATLIEEVYKTVCYVRTSQEGVLPALGNHLKTQSLPQVKNLIGMTPDKKSSEVQETIRTNRELQRQILQRGTDAPSPLHVVQDQRSEIPKRMEELKDLAVQKLLTMLIFADEDVDTAFPAILLIQNGQAASNLDISEDQLFQSALEQHFQSKPRSRMDEVRLSFHLAVTAPLLRFYFSHACTMLASDQTTFLTKETNDRIDDVLGILLPPLRDHLTHFSSALFNLSKPGEVLHRSVDKTLSERLPKNDKEQAVLLHKLATFLVDRYIPHISLLNQKERLTHLFQSLTTTRFEVLSSPLKSILQLCIYLLPFAPLFLLNHFHRYLAYSYLPFMALIFTFDSALRMLLRFALSKVALPRLLSSVTTVSKTNQYHFNRFVVQKLQASSTTPPKSSLLIHKNSSQQPELEKVIEQFCVSIPLQQSLRDQSSVHDFFQRFIKQEEYYAPHAAPTAARNILDSLEHTLESEHLSTLIFEALKEVTTILQKPSSPPSGATMNLEEQKLKRALEASARSGVEHTIATLLNPAQQLTEETNCKIQELRQFVLQFATQCSDEQVDIAVLERQWGTLSLMVIALGDHLNARSISSLVTLGNTITTTFLAASAAFQKSMRTPQPLRTQKARLEEEKHILVQAEGFFKELSPNNPTQIFNSLTAFSKQPIDDDVLKAATQAALLSAENQLANPYHHLPTAPKDYQIFFADFKTALRTSIDTVFTPAIDDTTTQIQEGTLGLRKASASLATWAEKNLLSNVVITPEEADSLSLQGLKFGCGAGIQNMLVDAVIKSGQCVLDMKSKPYHTDPLLWHILESFLNKLQ